MAPATKEKAKAEVIVEPFAIEADHPRNADLMIQACDHVRLRSRITSSRTVDSKNLKGPVIPKDQAAHLGSFPEIPGMQLHVDPAALTYKIVDPLYENDDLCERIERAMEVDGSPYAGEVGGVPPQEGKLHKDMMKCLCRELKNIVEEGEAKPVKGTIVPDHDEIDELPGNYLLNPGAINPNTQPRYEKDWDSWVEQLTRAGG